MAELQTEDAIFKGGSTTYYWSSKFFPKAVRQDVLRFYSFVRVADDYVDTIPANPAAFKDITKRWHTANNDAAFITRIEPSDTINERVIKNIIHVVRTYQCDPEWINAFLRSMQMDIDNRKYKTIDDTLDYIYGSAEVIGLVMSKIMGLPDAALPAAKMQGRAMQFINFLRDIAEDVELGRCYFPLEDLKRFGLPDISHKTAQAMPEKWAAFMRFELDRFAGWQREAEAGYQYIPKRLRVPLRTAAEMYAWTGTKITADPTVVFTSKIKPTKRRVLRKAALHTLFG